MKKIAIELLLRDVECEYSFSILVSGKHILYNREEDKNTHSNLLKLKSKSVEFVYLDRSSYLNYMKERMEEREKRLNLISKSAQASLVLKNLKEDEEMLKDVLQDVGVDAVKIDLIDNITKSNKILIQNTPSLRSLILKMNSMDDKILLKKQLISYIASEMISYIPELSKSSLEKFNLALFLFDLKLSKEQFWICHKKKEEVPKEIYLHGEELLQFLPTNDERFISPDFINFIKTHHEKPDGSGYPQGSDYNSFSIFNAIYVITEDFVSELITHEFKSNRLIDIILMINLKYGYYKELSPIFKKVLNAFTRFCDKNQNGVVDAVK